MANTVGIIAPPTKPWTARAAIMAPKLVAKAQARLASVKPAAERAKRTRVESSRASRPESGIMTISATR